MAENDNVIVAHASVSQNESELVSDEEDAEFENDEEDGSRVIRLPDMEAALHGRTTVNMANSSNVEIKPTTQFYAPVTIYMNGNSNASSSKAIAASQSTLVSKGPTNTFSSEAKLCDGPDLPRNSNVRSRIWTNIIMPKSSWKFRCIVLAAIVAITCVAVATYISLSQETIIEETRHPLSDDSASDLGDDFQLFQRDRWGGRPMINASSRPLVHPVPLVIIGHTGSEYYDDLASCSSHMQTIQTQHVGSHGWIDVAFNFVICGDGSILQALGWDVRNYERNNSIIVSVIGNYVFDNVNEKQRGAIEALLKRGVELGKLDPNYKLVGHNQVDNTESPGKNLAKDLRDWPHFYPGNIV